MNYKGVIIEESLSDTSVLDLCHLLETTIKPVTERHRTPWLKQWTLHTFEVDADRAHEFAKRLSGALERKHTWYADFKNPSEHIIVFPGKVFIVDRSKPDEYAAVKAYGISQGVPDCQLDFTPEIL